MTTPKIGTARLKSLELQGYKTFASKFAFAFAPTITAIIGPNGSGKSNITDALRWVLGEQSFSLLRGKKTEDMIFSGSETRPRASMAAATITFDNADGWLPIDFSEVTVSRRAYRDGQNEYLLNGQKVRLRDVNELLSKCGLAQRTYTVIGQGLVDAALSLRADERRRLFEEAAGIGLYRSKREEALRRLENTQRNLERVQDILAELKPRYRSLKRQVERSKDYDQVRDDLLGALRLWYGYHWYRLQDEIQGSAGRVSGQREAREALRAAQREAEARLQTVRTRISALRGQLTTWTQSMNARFSEREKAGRELAVAEERLRWVGEQASQWVNEIESLTDEQAGLEGEIGSASQLVEKRQAALQEARREHAKRLEGGEAGGERQKALQQELERATQALDGFRMRYAQWNAAGEQLAKEVEALRARAAALAGEIEQQGARLKEAQARQGSASAAVEEAQARFEQAQAALREARGKIAALRTEQPKASQQVTRLMAREAALKARLEMLQDGLKGAGGEEILKAAQSGEISGALGRLMERVRVRKELRAAIMAAMGEFGSGLTFPSLEGVMQALEWAASQDVGGGVLLPERPATDASRWNGLEDPDCLGNAAQMVECDAAARPLVDWLLGRTLIVRDRRAARRLLAALPPDARLVTLRGEVFFPGGVVVLASGGPAAGREIGLEETRSQLKSVGGELGAARALADQIESDLDGALQTEQIAQERLEAARRELAEAQQAQSGAALQVDVQASRLKALREQHETIEAERAERSQSLQNHQQQAEAMTAERKALERSLREAQESLAHSSLSQAMVRLEAQLEVLQLEAEEALNRREALAGRLARLGEALEAKKSALVESKKEQLRLERLVSERGEALARIERELEGLTEQMTPAEQELAEAEAERSELERDESRARADLQSAQREYTQAQIELARKQEEQASLRMRIEDDFGLVAFDTEEGTPGQAPLPFEGLVERLSRVDELPDDLEAQLNTLRLQLRRMGPVNPEARREYREVAERIEFLTTQVDDLRAAEKQLREVIAELDLLMEREFRKTYEAVAVVFRETFTRLFGGGSARLALTNPGDLTQSGIDIEARLPGRREQGLAMLSGGERSLTASALIFALLKVSPTPFCVLDEVDAMLDEANVNRFIELLRELSAETQFILITHNRLSVQAAEIVYGVSMGKDSASKVISLKLDEIDEKAVV